MKNIIGRIVWRLDSLRTSIYRSIVPRQSESDSLKQRIASRVRQLGKFYEDGNSDILGYTYHPIFFDGFSQFKSHRGECADRLKAILREMPIERGDWVLDVGANVGYFSFALESEGALVEAYEVNSDCFEIGAALSKLYGRNVLYINKSMSVNSLSYLRPKYKGILLLSVFHWIFKQEGEARAAKILEELSKRTRYIFFETPSSMDDAMFKNKHFSSKEAVENYLKKTLPNAKISELLQDQRWGGRYLYKIECTLV